MNKVTGSVDFTYRVDIVTYSKPGYEDEALHKRAMFYRSTQKEIGKRISIMEIEENVDRPEPKQVFVFMTPIEYYLQSLSLALKMCRKYVR